MRLHRLCGVVLSGLLLVGCASVPEPEERPEDLLELAGLSLPDVELPAPQGTVSRDEAIHQALWRNPRMQQGFADLQLTAADVVEASQFTNPSLSMSVLLPEGGGRSEVGLGLSWGLSGLLMRGSRLEIADAHLQSRRLQLAEAMLALASDTERAWFASVAARQHAEVQALEHRAADLALRMAERFHAAGNLNDKRLAELRITAANAELDLEEAQQQERDARLRLAFLMGQPGSGSDWQVPDALPRPLPDEMTSDHLTAEALSERLDLQALDQGLAGLTEGLALVRRYRWLGDIEPGIGFERERDGTRLYGPSLRVSLPVFHQNQAAQRRAAAQLAGGEASREALQQSITADVHAGQERLQHHRRRFQLLDETVLPTQAERLERIQERVNFMFDDVFDLLAAKQEELADWRRAVNVLDAYWQARVELAYLVGTDLPGGSPDEATLFDVSGLEHPPGAHGMQHDNGHEDHGDDDHHHGHEHDEHEHEHEHDHHDEHDEHGHGGHH